MFYTILFSFDSVAVKLLKEYLRKTNNKKGKGYYEGRIDGSFNRGVIEALGLVQKFKVFV